AQVWMASPEGLSVELGYPIPESLRGRLASIAEVVETEPYLYGFSYWRKPRGGSEVCCVIGSRLEEGALGVVSDLTPRMRTLLTEPGAVVVDESELDRLGVAGVGGVAEVAGQRVRVVGLVRGLKSLGPPYVFCSLRTVYLLQPLFRDYPGHTMYLLARCRKPDHAPALTRPLSRPSAPPPLRAGAWAGCPICRRSHAKNFPRAPSSTGPRAPRPGSAWASPRS